MGVFKTSRSLYETYISLQLNKGRRSRLTIITLIIIVILLKFLINLGSCILCMYTVYVNLYHLHDTLCRPSVVISNQPVDDNKMIKYFCNFSFLFFVVFFFSLSSSLSLHFDIESIHIV